ncbi:MAG: KpsF/GutQ family sugar-phosphate isomerase [Gammaproteobacteria bacterium]|nr:KpsF/GutQ family sugar-phosphate isomerase [Gammaproteobacteria bacterium]
MNLSDDNINRFCRLGKEVIRIEAEAVSALSERIDKTFAHACDYLLKCEGRIVVLGMGKSGHIGSKIAATLASTGSPAFFVHPGEASHGDLGMITAHDVVLALSYSGETKEVLFILPLIKRLGIPLVTITGNPQSTIALAANVNLNASVKQEACPLGLAPTSSTTATLAMGDALAIALLQARGFTAEDFALAHPGGSLGKRLLLHVGDVMHVGEAVPKVSSDVTISEALVEITRKRFGMTTVVNDKNELLGIYTDGDLRRTLDNQLNLHKTCIDKVMTKMPKTITANLLAAEGLRMMQIFKITSLVVVEGDMAVIGIVHLHDLLHAGVI